MTEQEWRELDFWARVASIENLESLQAPQRYALEQEFEGRVDEFFPGLRTQRPVIGPSSGFILFDTSKLFVRAHRIARFLIGGLVNGQSRVPNIDRVARTYS